MRPDHSRAAIGLQSRGIMIDDMAQQPAGNLEANFSGHRLTVFVAQVSVSLAVRKRDFD